MFMRSCRIKCWRVLDNSNWKILWNFTIQTGSCLPHDQPDITLVDKQKAVIKLIDGAVLLGDSCISQKAVEKKDWYRDLGVYCSEQIVEHFYVCCSSNYWSS